MFILDEADLVQFRETELRQTASTECVVRVRRPEESVTTVPFSHPLQTHANKSGNSPIRFAWLGGARFATNKEELKRFAITRQEYQENGSSWAGRKFSGTL